MCQALYFPVTPKLLQCKRLVFPIIALHSKDIFISTFCLLDGHLQSSLWPNVIETFYCILSGCRDIFGEASCKEWLYNYLVDESVMPKLPLQYRKPLFEAVFKYSLEDKRMFKVVLVDLAKVCNSEAMPDSLGAYV